MRKFYSLVVIRIFGLWCNPTPEWTICSRGPPLHIKIIPPFSYFPLPIFLVSRTEHISMLFSFSFFIISWSFMFHDKMFEVAILSLFHFQISVWCLLWKIIAPRYATVYNKRWLMEAHVVEETFFSSHAIPSHIFIQTSLWTHLCFLFRNFVVGFPLLSTFSLFFFSSVLFLLLFYFLDFSFSSSWLFSLSNYVTNIVQPRHVKNSGRKSPTQISGVDNLRGSSRKLHNNCRGLGVL